MMRRFLLLTLLLPLFCAGFGAGARAADPCTFTVDSPFAFGQNVDLISDPTASQAYNRNQTAAQIRIACNNIPSDSALAAQKARVCVSIPSDAPNARVMNWTAPPSSARSPISASNGKLYFGIYKDVGRLEVWSTAFLDPSTHELTNGETATISFYGKINPYQGTASVGSYTGSFPVQFRVYLYSSAGGTPPPLCR